MKKSFFNCEKPVLTVMVQANTPDRVKELIDLSRPNGAEAYGMQFEQMHEEYCTAETYRELFQYAGDLPVYATNYRTSVNVGKSDEQLSEELLLMADCGADLCDVMGDYFDRQPDEVAKDPVAEKKQMELIDKLHQKGAKVLMSSHVLKYTSAERVLEIAQIHQRRGADICKIVTYANSPEEEFENLKIIDLLKNNLKIPFLFLCGGECKTLRRVGIAYGCCMALCLHEVDAIATREQPLLTDEIRIREQLL